MSNMQKNLWQKENSHPLYQNSGQKFEHQQKSFNSQISMVSFGCLSVTENMNQNLEAHSQSLNDDEYFESQNSYRVPLGSSLQDQENQSQSFQCKRSNVQNLFSNSIHVYEQSTESQQSLESSESLIEQNISISEKTITQGYQQQIMTLNFELEQLNSQNCQIVEYAEFLISQVNKYKDEQQNFDNQRRDQINNDLRNQQKFTERANIKNDQISLETQNKIISYQQTLNQLSNELLEEKHHNEYLNEMLTKLGEENNQTKKEMLEVKEQFHQQDGHINQLIKQNDMFQQQKMKEDIKLKDGEPEKKIIIILEENKKLNELANEKLAEIELLKKDTQKNENLFMQNRKQLMQQYEMLLQERQQNFDVEKQTLQQQNFELSESLRKYQSGLKEEFETQIKIYKDQSLRQTQIITSYQIQIQNIEYEYTNSSEFLKQKIQSNETQYKEFYAYKEFSEQKIQVLEWQMDQQIKSLQQAHIIIKRLEYEISQTKHDVSLKQKLTKPNQSDNSRKFIVNKDNTFYQQDFNQDSSKSVLLDSINSTLKKYVTSDFTASNQSINPTNQQWINNQFNESNSKASLLSNDQSKIKREQTVRKNIFDQGSRVSLARSHSQIN